MIALVRQLGIPCRYVSGYLYHREEDNDRSISDAHACLGGSIPAPPGMGGLRSHECLIASDRHIRTAIGRDYADVPPTKGSFGAVLQSDLYVAVQVTASEKAPALDQELPIPEDWSMLVERAQAPPPPPAEPLLQQLQQAQQQQAQQQ